jgi:hypothetical protein
MKKEKRGKFLSEFPAFRVVFEAGSSNTLQGADLPGRQ